MHTIFKFFRLSLSEIYFLSSKINGSPKIWSPCIWVKIMVSKSAGEIPYFLMLESAVGGASMRCFLSNMAREWFLPCGRKAFPVPRNITPWAIHKPKGRTSFSQR